MSEPSEPVMKNRAIRTPTQYRIEYGPHDYLEWRPASGNTVEITDILVTTRRRDGIGRSMLNHLLDQIPKDVKLVWAITRTSNRIAQLFYENTGFRVVAVLREFYKDEEKRTADAIMFGRDINRADQ